LPFILNKKEFHSFDDIKKMIENIIGFKLPKDDLFSDDESVRNFVFKFNVKASPNSSKIVGPNGNEKNYNRGLDEFCMLNLFRDF